MLTLNKFTESTLKEISALFPPQRLQRFTLATREVCLSFEEFAFLLSYIQQMPALSSISLEFTPFGEGWDGELAIPEWPSTIRYLSLDWPVINEPLHPYVLGMQSLKELYLRCYLPSEFSFSQCSSTGTLRSLELAFNAYETVEEIGSIDLPSLEVLRITGPFDYIESFLQQALAPLLLQLDLWIPMVYEDVTFEWLLANFFDCSSSIWWLHVGELAFQGLDNVPPLCKLRNLSIILNDWNDLISWKCLNYQSSLWSCKATGALSYLDGSQVTVQNWRQRLVYCSLKYNSTSYKT